MGINLTTSRPKIWKQMILNSFLILFLCSCSFPTTGLGPAHTESQKQLPQTAQELIRYEPGIIAGTHFYAPEYPYRQDVAKILDQLPNLLDGMDKAILQDYWTQLAFLFSEDYLSPQMVIDRWRVASFGSPDVEDARFQFRENFNVEIVLDASGSMSGKIGDKTKMQMAKEAIKEFASSLPEGARVSLRVYGHKGSNLERDKSLSCNTSQIVYPLQPYDAGKLDSALKQFEPTGWTSIAQSLQLAKEDLAAFDAKRNTNLIYLVSDGIETCGGDPVKVAKELSESQVMPLLNVIGFDVNAEGQKQLKEIAKAAQGLYANVTNQAGFKEELERAREIAQKWEQWKKNALTELDSVRVDRRKWIDRYARDWYEKNWRESLNLGAAIEYLAATGKIGGEAKTYFDNQREEREVFVTRSEEEVTSYLLQLTEKTYREMKDEIEQKYTTN